MTFMAAPDRLYIVDPRIVYQGALGLSGGTSKGLGRRPWGCFDEKMTNQKNKVSNSKRRFRATTSLPLSLSTVRWLHSECRTMEVHDLATTPPAAVPTNI